MHSLRIVALVACVVGFAALVAAQDTALDLLERDERDSLTGIRPIKVVVEGMQAGAERDGLTAQLLQAAVELRLRLNGIPLSDGALPYLYVRVNTMKLSTMPNYVYCIDVAFKQAVQIVTTGRLVVRATTWERGSVGIRPADELRGVRDRVLDYVDEFSNDYLAVNPLPAGRPLPPR